VRARLLVVVCALATFARALPYPLQRSWDDGRFLIDNPDAARVSLKALWSFFSQVHFEAYHPLHLLSYWIDVPWAGPNPLVLHAVSLGLWVAALLCVHALLRELGLSAAAAVLGTLACGLHPAQVEAVSWATGRKDVLALLFAAASLLWHIRARSTWDRAAWYARALFVAAALAKTTSLALQLFACVLDLAVLRLRPREALARLLPTGALAAALGAVVVTTWQQSSMLRTTLGGFELAPVRVCATYAAQLVTACWPAKSSPMYAANDVATCTTSALLVVSAFLIAIWIAWRSAARCVFAGLVGFAMLMLPVSNLIPMYFPLQDRYLSLPLLPLSLAVAAACDRLARAGATRWLLAVAVIALAVRTFQYEGEWQSETRLWGHAASTQPRAEYAWLKLGEVRRDASDIEGAIAADRQLVRLMPTRNLAYAALFEATALRDERVFALAPGRAREFARQAYVSLSDAAALRALGASLLAAGYLRSLELPLALALAQEPLPDSVLERLASEQLQQGHASVARFYADQLHIAANDPRLRELQSRPSYRVLP
jgi:hypothetical protein